jgi:tetratricopeptide (TPR) repeat protein
MKKVYFNLTRILLFSIILSIPLAFYAQDDGEAKKKEKTNMNSSFSPYWYFQGDIGPSFSHADLSDYGFLPDLKHVSINGQLGFGRQFTRVWSIYLNAERGFFNGEKADVVPKNLAPKNTSRDLKFDNDYYGGNLNVGINLSNWWGGYKDRLVNFGIHIGVGQVQWKSRTYDMANNDKVVATYGYSFSPANNKGKGINDRKVAMTVPLGATINFNVSERWDIYGDYAYTWMDTDVADGVVHGEMEVFNDVYSHFNIGARIKFGSNKIKKMADNFDEVQLTATPDPLEEVGDSVEVTIKGTFPPKYFAKNAVMCFTPVLKYEGGETAFETINFIGEDVDGEGTMISWANGGSFTYTKKIPYDPAMDNSELTVTPVAYQYNGEVHSTCDGAAGQGKSYTADERKLADGVIHTAGFVRDNELVAFAPDGYEKETISTVESAIFFQVNRSNLNKNLPLNKDAGNKETLNNSIGDMEKGWVVKDIAINGWASPEGEETFNEGLSQKRAETAEKYMNKKIKKAAKHNKLIDKEAADGIEFNLTANGPDWNGFMQAVEASDIKDKNAIINVINSADYSQKEAEIRNMILIYPELERDILPPLRRAVIDVNCFEPKRTAEQIAEYSTAYPDSLSVNELMYAATLTDDLNTRKQIYDNTMKRYPTCWRAKVNGAAVEFELGNIDEAKALLEQAHEINENSFEMANNMGGVHVAGGDYAKAEHCYLKSEDLGGDVNYNMGIVEIHKGNYANAVSRLSGYTCNFNLGLAQLLNKDYAAAENTFNCVDPQDGDTYYLLAVTGARQDDKAKTLDYLGKAIKANPDFKAKAATDREFLKFYHEADFQALTGANN